MMGIGECTIENGRYVWRYFDNDWNEYTDAGMNTLKVRPQSGTSTDVNITVNIVFEQQEEKESPSGRILEL